MDTRAATIATSFTTLAMLGAVLITGTTLASWGTVVFAAGLAGALYFGAMSTPGWLALAVFVLPTSLLIAAVAQPPEMRIATIGIATWVLLASSMIYVRRDVLLRALTWMLPVYAAHACVMLLQSVGGQRVEGIVGNANAAAALLVLGVVSAMMHPRLRWLAVLFAVAVPFTGSRWGTVVFLAAIVAMIVLRYAPLVGAMAFLAFVAVVAIQLDDMKHLYRIQSTPQATAQKLSTDASKRLASARTPGLMPQGHTTTAGEHSVYLRVANETGIVGGGVWAGLTGLALWRGRGRELALLAAVAVLGLVEYYAYQPGKLSVFFWALIGANIRRGQAYETPY